MSHVAACFIVNPTIPCGSPPPKDFVVSRPSAQGIQATAPGNAKDSIRDEINTILIQWQGLSATRAIARTDIIRFYDDRSIGLELSDKIRNSIPTEVWDLLGISNLYSIPEE